MTVVGNIIKARKNLNKPNRLKNTMNYNTIREEMGFNSKKRIRPGEMGGSWKLVRKNGGWDIEFIDNGIPIQTIKNRKQMIRLNMSGNAWHTHPHPETGRGFWPSREDLRAVQKLDIGKYHLIITIYGTWVLSSTIPTNHSRQFNAEYNRLHQYFDGVVKNKRLEQLGKHHELQRSKNKNLVLNHMIKTDISRMDEIFSKHFGIRIKFFKYKKDVIEYLKDKIPVHNNQS